MGLAPCTRGVLTMRKILHSDADCFYAAVEMRDHPEYRGRPLAVGGHADARGVIATCNYEARRFGVRSAMASAHALRLCPDLLLIPGRMDVYRAVSQHIFRIYRRYTDWVEPVSLDEAYLDVSEAECHQGSATRIAQAIRAEVEAQTGITVSMGVAPNKFLAKIASDWNKPNGLKVIVPEAVSDFVADLAVERLHGVGQRTKERLHAQGLFTCRDIRARSLLDMMSQFGALGQRLFELAHGRDDRPVTPDSIRKSVSTEQTYPEDLSSLTDCLAQLPDLLADLTRRFERLEEYRIQGALVKVKFSDFTQTTVERALVAPDRAVFNELLAEGWARQAMPVRLLGVGYRLQHRTQQSQQQMELPFVSHR